MYFLFFVADGIFRLPYFGLLHRNLVIHALYSPDLIVELELELVTAVLFVTELILSFFNHYIQVIYCLLVFEDL